MFNKYFIFSSLYDQYSFVSLHTQCSQTTSLDAFFKLFQRNTTYVTLLGCGCSPATIPVAEISHYWNIPQVKK